MVRLQLGKSLDHAVELAREQSDLVATRDAAAPCEVAAGTDGQRVLSEPLQRADHDALEDAGEHGEQQDHRDDRSPLRKLECALAFSQNGA